MHPASLPTSARLLAFPSDRIVREPVRLGLDQVAVIHRDPRTGEEHIATYDTPRDLHAAVLVTCAPQLEAAEAAAAARAVRAARAAFDAGTDRWLTLALVAVAALALLARAFQ